MANAELESSAEFKRRAHLGVSEANIQALELKGFDSFAKYAFSVPYTPGNPDETSLMNFLKKVLASAPDDAQLACLRRLFWESHALALSDLKHRQQHGSESVAKRLPAAERVARAKDQRGRLTGAVWGPETEPSDQSVDRFVQMVEDNVVIYLKPELCTSRSQEILQVKQTKNFSIGSDGNLKVAQQAANFTCNTTGELRASFHRKALAMDLAGLLRYNVAEMWRTNLFTSLQREVPATKPYPYPRSCKQTNACGSCCQSGHEATWRRAYRLTAALRQDL